MLYRKLNILNGDHIPNYKCKILIYHRKLDNAGYIGEFFVNSAQSHDAITDSYVLFRLRRAIFFYFEKRKTNKLINAVCI